MRVVVMIIRMESETRPYSIELTRKPPTNRKLVWPPLGCGAAMRFSGTVEWQLSPASSCQSGGVLRGPTRGFQEFTWWRVRPSQIGILRLFCLLACCRKGVLDQGIKAVKCILL